MHKNACVTRFKREGWIRRKKESGIVKTFKGGFHIPENKYLAEHAEIEQMPIVPEYFVSLSQHIGKPAECLVAAGDVVVEGQMIARASGAVSANVFSPVCGEVVGIEKRCNAQGALVDYVHIKSNGEQNVVTLPKLENPTREQIIARIAEAGIVGMGGAGFPAAVKAQPREPVDTLIINAAECEPYLCRDNRLMVERTEEFIEGVRLLAEACNVKQVIIGIEANKLEAYSALMCVDGVVAEDQPRGESDIVVVLLKPKYPQGAEKTLVYACTKRVIPVGKLPSAVGCVVFSVSTAYAVREAVVNGTPLYKTVMTITGRGINTPKNVEVRTGTPIGAVVDFCGGLLEDTVKICCGGPMMGFSLIDTEVATTKTSGGFLALTEREINKVMPSACIRCGRCADHCPMKLTPMLIDFYTEAGDTENAIKYGALNCFECGTCAYMCPARRPIVQGVRISKMKAKEKK